MFTMKSTICVMAGLALSVLVLTGCPDSPGGGAFTYTVKLTNTGDFPVLGAFIKAQGAKEVDWSENLLTQPLLTREYTILPDAYSKGRYDFSVVFEVTEDGQTFEEEFELEGGIDTTSLTEDMISAQALRSDRFRPEGGTWRTLGYNYGEMAYGEEVPQVLD